MQLAEERKRVVDSVVFLGLAGQGVDDFDVEWEFFADLGQSSHPLGFLPGGDQSSSAFDADRLFRFDRRVVVEFVGRRIQVVERQFRKMLLPRQDRSQVDRCLQLDARAPIVVTRQEFARQLFEFLAIQFVVGRQRDQFLVMPPATTANRDACG